MVDLLLVVADEAGRAELWGFHDLHVTRLSKGFSYVFLLYTVYTIFPHASCLLAFVLLTVLCNQDLEGWHQRNLKAQPEHYSGLARQQSCTMHNTFSIFFWRTLSPSQLVKSELSEKVCNWGFWDQLKFHACSAGVLAFCTCQRHEICTWGCCISSYFQSVCSAKLSKLFVRHRCSFWPPKEVLLSNKWQVCRQMMQNVLVTDIPLIYQYCPEAVVFVWCEDYKSMCPIVFEERVALKAQRHRKVSCRWKSAS